MNIKVEALSIKNVEQLTQFLCSVDFSQTPHWATCFCRFYYMNCTPDVWKNRSGDENKQDMIEAVKQDLMHGFLAFIDESCVGWVNATDIENLTRLDDVVKPHLEAKKWGVTICFVIANQYRGQKIATTLLQTSISHFREKGYEGMLALPFEHPTSKEQEYRGPVSLYHRLGYTVVEERDHTKLMKLTF